MLDPREPGSDSQSETPQLSRRRLIKYLVGFSVVATFNGEKRQL